MVFDQIVCNKIILNSFATHIDLYDLTLINAFRLNLPAFW